MRLLAIADLRLREGVAARLPWLVGVAFVVGVGAALWVTGPDAATRTALADRIVLWTTWGLAFVVAAVLPALGLPSDIRTGAAQGLFASPASRLEILAGGTLGYGAFATLLLAAMAGASVLGMQVAGLGAGQREPVRPVVRPPIVDAAADGTFRISNEAPVARFVFRVPPGAAAGEPLRVRFAPRRVVESGMEPETRAFVSVHRPGGDESEGRDVSFKAGTAFTVSVPAGNLLPGDEAELSLRRTRGLWHLVFRDGSVEIGGGRELYSVTIVTASLCAAPLLFVLAALGSMGAARFGAPTAVMLAVFLFAVFVGQDLLADGARFIVAAANDPSMLDVHDEPGAEHEHGPAPGITPLRVAAAKATLAAVGAMPSYDSFDRTGDLVERRALALRDVGRAFAAGLPTLAAVTAAGWLLLRRRELQPG